MPAPPVRSTHDPEPPQHPAPELPDSASSRSAAEPIESDHDEVPTAPREAIAYWRQRDPDIGIDDLAQRVRKSPRQIRRDLETPAHTPGPKVNGRQNDLANPVRSGRP